MKKIIAVLVIIGLLSVPVTASASERIDVGKDSAEYQELVEQAILVLSDAWNDFYWEEDYPDKEYLLDIRSTRIICIKDTLEEKQEEYFGGIRYVIEFLLYSDYMAVGENTSGLGIGYYDYIGMNDNVVVYEDGHMECQSHVLVYYRNRTFDSNLSTFIDKVIDLHEQYNREIRFKGHEVILSDNE